MNNNLTHDFFQWLGLDEEEIGIYNALHKQGDLSILQIARILELPRTSVYRKFEKMKSMGIVEEVIGEYTTKVKAANPDDIEYLFLQKKRDYEHFQEAWPKIKNSLQQLTQTADKFTKVYYYQGQEGMARMSWQALYAKEGLRGYTYRQYAEVLGKKETESFKERWAETGKFGKEIYSDTYVNSITENPNLETGDWIRWESRYIAPVVLTIEQQLDIYDDVVAFYGRQGNELFGVQIVNEKIAKFQKQLFDIVWKIAEKR